MFRWQDGGEGWSAAATTCHLTAVAAAVDRPTDLSCEAAAAVD
jgi:hypothetical protein